MFTEKKDTSLCVTLPQESHTDMDVLIIVTNKNNITYNNIINPFDAKWRGKFIFRGFENLVENICYRGHYRILTLFLFL